MVLKKMGKLMRLTAHTVTLITAALLILAGALIFKMAWLKRRPLTFNLSSVVGKSNLLPVAIVGSGPAGLSAAVYTARAKIKTVVFAGHERGGQLAHIKHIENWPGKEKMTGSHIMKDLEEQAERFGTHIINQAVQKADLSRWPFKLWSDDGTEFHALSMIIATGSAPQKLPIPGISEYWAKGISTCAICDAPFNKDQDVLVVGGGEAGAELARQLSAYAKKVTLITQEPFLTVCATVQDHLAACKNIEILYSTTLVRVDGDTQTATSATIKSIPSGVQTKLPIKAIYLGVGYQPNSALFKPAVKTDKEGYIIVNGRSQKTSIEGVCAAGSVEEKGYSKAGIAAGNGMKAALDIWHFLESKGINTPELAKLEPAFYKNPHEHTSSLKPIKTIQEFNTLIEKSKTPVIVDFFATYCPSCVYVLSLLEKLAASKQTAKNAAKAAPLYFYSVDVDQAPAIAQKLGISTIPAVVVFDKGKEQKRYQNIELSTLAAELEPWIAQPA